MSQSFIKKPDNGPHSALGGLGVLASEQSAMTPEEWQRRCAARYMERGGVGEHSAIQMAREAWVQEQDHGDPNSGWMSPEEAADEDMSYWEDDGDE